MTSESYVLTVSLRDKPGIVAAISRVFTVRLHETTDASKVDCLPNMP
jgi:predicted amino acid-binding ACT domain protein